MSVAQLITNCDLRNATIKCDNNNNETVIIFTRLLTSLFMNN